MPGVATYTLTVNAMPAAPVIGTITNLTCAVGTGSVVLNGLPSAGTWSLTRNPGAIITSGSGTSTTVSGLAAGTYNFSVTSAEGCVSAVSADAVVNPAPAAPSAPVVGTITQPTCAISTGSVVLSGLPATGTWILTRSPGSVKYQAQEPLLLSQHFRQVHIYLYCYQFDRMYILTIRKCCDKYPATNTFRSRW